jgi:hypothetical protein
MKNHPYIYSSITKAMPFVLLLGAGASELAVNLKNAQAQPLSVGAAQSILDNILKREIPLHPVTAVSYNGTNISANAIYGPFLENDDYTFFRNALLNPDTSRHAFVKFGRFTQVQKDRMDARGSPYLELPPDSITGTYPDSSAFVDSLAEWISQTAYPGQRYHVFHTTGKANSPELTMRWNEADLENTLGDTTKYGADAVPGDGYLILYSQNLDSLPWAGIVVNRVDLDTFYVDSLLDSRGFFQVFLEDSVTRNHFSLPDPPPDRRYP